MSPRPGLGRTCPLHRLLHPGARGHSSVILVSKSTRLQVLILLGGVRHPVARGRFWGLYLGSAVWTQVPAPPLAGWVTLAG